MDNPTTESIFHKRIEALCLGPHVSDEALAKFLQRCLQERDNLAAVAPNLHQVRAAAEALSGSGVTVAAQIAYPLGLIPWPVKRLQIEAALQDGASQVDLVMPVEMLKSGQFDLALQEGQALADLAQAAGARFTLIANLGYLVEAEQKVAIEIALTVGAALRTGSGIGLETSPEQVVQVQRLARSLREGCNLPVVACGGVNLAQTAVSLLRAGAERVCTGELFSLLDGQRTLLRHGWEAM